MKNLKIKSWVLKNIEVVSKDGFIAWEKLVIESETEKAFKIVNENGKLISWIPKSAMIDQAEVGFEFDNFDSELGIKGRFDKEGKQFLGFFNGEEFTTCGFNPQVFKKSEGTFRSDLEEFTFNK